MHNIQNSGLEYRVQGNFVAWQVKILGEKECLGYRVKWVTRADIDRIKHHMSAGSMPAIAVGRKDSSSDFYQITQRYLKPVQVFIFVTRFRLLRGRI